MIEVCCFEIWAGGEAQKYDNSRLWKVMNLVRESVVFVEK